MSERYARHQLIPRWDQERLASSRVVVIGVGALGNEVARILAMSGTGSLVLCDPDTVSPSNLSRCVLFREGDVGRPKVDAAAEQLSSLNPQVRIESRPVPFVHGVGLGELRDASLVLSCLDSRAGRLALSGRCSLAGARLIDAGTHPWGGEVRPRLDPQGSCYGCSLSVRERAIADAPVSCMDPVVAGEEGAAAPSSSLVGSWMGLFAVRALLGLSVPVGYLEIDGATGSTSIAQVARDPECPLHAQVGRVEVLDVTARSTVADLMNALPDGSGPVAWAPIPIAEECGACGFLRREVGSAERHCPVCGMSLRVRTTYQIAGLDRGMRLSDLGIPPREVFPIQASSDVSWVELGG
jgi:molybdopterin/thiamine biosynthesis adenylyltransferase